MDSFIFLDIETTGFKPANGAEMLEFAGMKCNPKTLAPYGRYQTMVFPKNGINKKAQEVNHITFAMVENAPMIEDVIGEIASYIKPSDSIIGHNVKKFDVPFMEFYLGRKFENKIIDTLELARKAGFHKGCLKQTELAEHFSIISESHRAMVDVEVNWKIYKKLIQMIKVADQGKLFE